MPIRLLGSFSMLVAGFALARWWPVAQEIAGTSISVALLATSQATFTKLDWHHAIRRLNLPENQDPRLLSGFLAEWRLEVPWVEIAPKLANKDQQHFFMELWLDHEMSTARAALAEFIAQGKMPEGWLLSLPRPMTEARAAIAAEPEISQQKILILAQVRHLARTAPAAGWEFCQAHHSIGSTYLFERWAERDFHAALAACRAMPAKSSEPVNGLKAYLAALPWAEQGALLRAASNSSGPPSVLDLVSAELLAEEYDFWVLRFPEDGAYLGEAAWIKQHPQAAIDLLARLPAKRKLGYLKELTKSGTLAWRDLIKMDELNDEELGHGLQGALEHGATSPPEDWRELLNAFPATQQNYVAEAYMGLVVTHPETLSHWVTTEPHPAKQAVLKGHLIGGLLGGGWRSPHDHMIQLEKTPDPALRASLFAHLLVHTPENREHYATWMQSPVGQSLDPAAVRLALAQLPAEMAVMQDPSKPDSPPAAAEISTAAQWLDQWRPAP